MGILVLIAILTGTTAIVVDSDGFDVNGVNIIAPEQKYTSEQYYGHLKRQDAHNKLKFLAETGMTMKDIEAMRKKEHKSHCEWSKDKDVCDSYTEKYGKEK